MFERFTERARKVVVQGQNEAARLRHNRIGTEHLLLGLLLEEDGVAAQSLFAVGVTLDGAREQVESMVGFGEEHSGQAPFTARAKKVLEHSLEEALVLGHNYIGTEHLLLGLLREPEDVATTAISNLGADPEAARREVTERIGGTERPRRSSGPLERAREVLRRSFRRYPPEKGGPGYERFAAQGRRVVVLGQDEARRLNHDYIGTEHLLLGMIRDEGLGGQVLRALNVSLDEAREHVESIVGCGEEATARAPLTPRTQKVLQMAGMEAQQLDDTHVSSEHILLGLVREGEGVAARVLSDLGVGPDEVRQEIARRIPGREPEVDPSDEVGKVIEGEESRMLFQGRVTGIRAELNLPRPLPVSVDIAYSYLAVGEFAGVEPGDIAELIRDELPETERRSLEAVITALGERLLTASSEVSEATVTVSGVPDPGDPDAPTFSVSATFER